MKMKVDFKNIDWKQLLIQKGERIALYVAGALTLVLIIIGIGIKGFGSGSATANAEELAALKQKGDERLRTSRPDPKIGEVDPQILGASNPMEIDNWAYAAINPWFKVLALDDNRWRKPDVLAPDEFEAVIVRGLVRLYPAPVNGKIPLLIRKAEDKEAADRNQTAFDKFRRRNTRRPPATTPATGRPNQPASGRGGPGMGGMPGGMRPGATGYGGDKGAAGKEEYQIKTVALDDVDPKTHKMMEIPLPERMALVTGSFPYRDQLEAFRRALRFSSVNQMLNDPDVNIEFLDLEVERRLVSEGKPGDWAPLDLAALKRLMIQAVGREPDDAKLFGAAFPVSPRRLAMQRPKLVARQQYPDALPEGVSKTLQDLSAKQPAPVAPRKPNKFEIDPDLFEEENPGGGSKGATGPVAGAPTGVVTGTPSGAAATIDANVDGGLPEKCLVRFLDVDVEPGKTYQYRVRVKTTNPNYKQTDKAVSTDLTIDEYLYGPWKEVGKDVVVPPDLYFYAVDEQPEERTRLFEPANQDRAAVQIHKWIEKVNFNNSEFWIGDWAILKRVIVYRGEVIGKTDEVEVPAWFPTFEQFLFVMNPQNRKLASGRQTHKGIPVDFSTGAILVDFEGGGKRTFTVGTKTVTDEAPAEMLVLTADGRLTLDDARRTVARNGRQDLDDSKRKDRVASWEGWQKKVRDNVDEVSGEKKKGGDQPLFDKPPNR